METVIQTRLPEELNKKLKMEALSTGVHTKRRVSSIINAFMQQEPWLRGTWVKQPKTNSEFRPLTVKIPTEQAYAFETLAERLEVSTSSLAYTAIDWHFKQFVVACTTLNWHQTQAVSANPIIPEKT